MQTLKTPGGGELFTVPAVWRQRSRTTVFVADGDGPPHIHCAAGACISSGPTPRRGQARCPGRGAALCIDPSAGGIGAASPTPRARSQRLSDAARALEQLPDRGERSRGRARSDANRHESSGTSELSRFARCPPVCAVSRRCGSGRRGGPARRWLRADLSATRVGAGADG